MAFSNTFFHLKVDNIGLYKIHEDDKDFIATMFSDEDVIKNYRIPIELKEDYRRLIGYWLNDIRKGGGYTWIINEKDEGDINSIKECGFIAFEFRGTLKNVRLSYALLPQFRNKGIMSKSVKFIIKVLRSLGVETIEAKSHMYNLRSEKLLEKLGFTTVSIDIVTSVSGEKSVVSSWTKRIVNHLKPDFFIIEKDAVSQLFNSETTATIWEEQRHKQGEITYFGGFEEMQKTGRYHFMIESEVTEKLVGISSNEDCSYYVSWEILREKQFGNKFFLIFSGWEHSNTWQNSNTKFDYHEIGIEKSEVEKFISTLISKDSRYFSIEKLEKVIGFEGFKFRNQ